MRLLLILLFIVVPDRRAGGDHPGRRPIGVWPTIAILIADSMLGSVLMRSQGRVAWRRFNLAVQEGRRRRARSPTARSIIFGGALLLTPGFLTDILGIAAAAAADPAIVRRLLVRAVARRMACRGRELHGARGARPAGRRGPTTSTAPPPTSTGAAPAAVIDPELERPRPGAGASAGVRATP